MSKQKTNHSEMTQPEITQRAAVAKAVQDAIAKVLDDAKEEQLTAARLAELMKLIQMQKELAADEPRTINVQWIETWESKPSNEG